MAQLSKREVPEEVWEQTWEWLVYIIGISDSSESVNVLLSGLLTQTERVMVAKRLMVGILLLSGWPTQAISKQIALSISTIYKERELLEANEDYRTMLETQFEEVIAEQNKDASGEAVEESMEKVMKKKKAKK